MPFLWNTTCFEKFEIFRECGPLSGGAEGQGEFREKFNLVSYLRQRYSTERCCTTVLMGAVAVPSAYLRRVNKVPKPVVLREIIGPQADFFVPFPCLPHVQHCTDIWTIPFNSTSRVQHSKHFVLARFLAFALVWWPLDVRLMMLLLLLLLMMMMSTIVNAFTFPPPTVFHAAPPSVYDQSTVLPPSEIIGK